MSNGHHPESHEYDCGIPKYRKLLSWIYSSFYTHTHTHTHTHQWIRGGGKVRMRVKCRQSNMYIRLPDSAEKETSTRQAWQRYTVKHKPCTRVSVRAKPASACCWGPDWGTCTLQITVGIIVFFVTINRYFFCLRVHVWRGSEKYPTKVNSQNQRNRQEFRTEIRVVTTGSWLSS